MAQIRDAARTVMTESKAGPGEKDGDAGRQMARSRVSDVLDLSERILAAAAECVSALGAAQVSMQAVADGAGVSKALIHYHFRDRDELLARLADWITVELVQGEEVALDGAPDP